MDQRIRYLLNNLLDLETKQEWDKNIDYYYTKIQEELDNTQYFSLVDKYTVFMNMIKDYSLDQITPEKIFELIYTMSSMSTKIPCLTTFLYNMAEAPADCTGELIISSNNTIKTQTLGMFNYRKNKEKFDAFMTFFSERIRGSQCPVNIMLITIKSSNVSLFLDKVPILIYMKDGILHFEITEVRMINSVYYNRLVKFLYHIGMTYAEEYQYENKDNSQDRYIVKNQQVTYPSYLHNNKLVYRYLKYYLLFNCLNMGYPFTTLMEHVNKALHSINEQTMQFILSNFSIHIIDNFSTFFSTIVDKLLTGKRYKNLNGLYQLESECKADSECESGKCIRNRCVPGDPDYSEKAYIRQIMGETGILDTSDKIRLNIIPDRSEIESLEMVDIVSACYEAIQIGNLEVIKSILTRIDNFNKRNIKNIHRFVIDESIKIGNIDIYKYVITKGKISENDIALAIEYNRNNITNYILEYLAKHKRIRPDKYYSVALETACKINNQNLVDFFLEKTDVNIMAIRNAAENGHTDLLVYLIDKVKGDQGKIRFKALDDAVTGGQLDTSKWIWANWDIKIDIKRAFDLVLAALYGGNKELIEFFVNYLLNLLSSKKARLTKNDIRIMTKACVEGGHMESLNYIIDKFEDIEDVYTYELLYHSNLEDDNIDMFKYVLGRIGPIDDDDKRRLIEFAIYSNAIKIVTFMVESGFIPQELYQDIYDIAVDAGIYRIMVYLDNFRSDIPRKLREKGKLLFRREKELEQDLLEKLRLTEAQDILEEKEHREREEKEYRDANLESIVSGMDDETYENYMETYYPYKDYQTHMRSRRHMIDEYLVEQEKHRDNYDTNEEDKYPEVSDDEWEDWMQGELARRKNRRKLQSLIDTETEDFKRKEHLRLFPSWRDEEKEYEEELRRQGLPIKKALKSKLSRLFEEEEEGKKEDE